MDRHNDSVSIGTKDWQALPDSRHSVCILGVNFREFIGIHYSIPTLHPCYDGTSIKARYAIASITCVWHFRVGDVSLDEFQETIDVHHWPSALCLY